MSILQNIPVGRADPEPARVAAVSGHAIVSRVLDQQALPVCGAIPIRGEALLVGVRCR